MVPNNTPVRAARRSGPLLLVCALLMLAACRNEPAPTPPPEPPPVQPVPKGTSVEVDREGVEVESPAGAVKFSEDSARIELPPKE